MLPTHLANTSESGKAYDKMGRNRRSRVHKAQRDTKRSARTRARTRDLDLIQGLDMKPERRKQLEERQELDEDLPGLGQYYCVECAKYYETEVALQTHKKGGVHKRRVKELKEPAYTIEESLRASGQSGTDNKQRDVSATVTSSIAVDATAMSP